MSTKIHLHLQQNFKLTSSYLYTSSHPPPGEQGSPGPLGEKGASA